MSESEQSSEPALARWPVFLMGAGLGLLAAYVLDPQNGRGRRAQMRDQSRRLSRRALRAADRRLRDLNHRFEGLYAELTGRFRGEAEVDDATLVQRVRSEFGHAVRFAQAVRVDAQGGVITLSGPVLSENVAKLLACVRAVPGVRRVVDELDRQERSEQVSH